MADKEKDKKDKKEKPSKPMDAMQDLKWLLIILAILGFFWYVNGGYQKSKDALLQKNASASPTVQTSPIDQKTYIVH